MATTYEEVFEAGRKHFKDYDFLYYDDYTKDAIMLGFLNSTIADFEGVCKTDLTDRDDDTGEFGDTLTGKEIEILGLGIAYYWLLGQTLVSDAYRLIPSTRDYTYSSPATMLDSVSSLKDSLEKEFTKRIINYSYTNSGIADLRA